VGAIRRLSAALAAAWMAAAAAQDSEPVAQTQPVSPPGVIQARTLDQPPGVVYAIAPPAPEAVARAFVEGCIAHEGDLTAVVDWAISEGYLPRDPLSSEAQTLLDGRAGSVFLMPGNAAPVYLVAMSGGRCIVWAEGAVGPATHQALLRALGELAGRTGRLEKTLERHIERGGTWRRQLQWRYRRAGGYQDFGIDAVTTLTEQPGVQAFHLAPVARTSRYDPDGMPAR
jgi:hypothetical protein